MRVKLGEDDQKVQTSVTRQKTTGDVMDNMITIANGIISCIWKLLRKKILEVLIGKNLKQCEVMDVN